MIPTNSKQVIVSTSSIEALGEPQFAIEHEGRLYVTMAVLAYNPDDPNLSDEDGQMVNDLRERIEAESGPTRAVCLTRELAEFVQIND